MKSGVMERGVAGASASRRVCWTRLGAASTPAARAELLTAGLIVQMEAPVPRLVTVPA